MYFTNGLWGGTDLSGNRFASVTRDRDNGVVRKGGGPIMIIIYRETVMRLKTMFTAVAALTIVAGMNLRQR